MKAFPKKGTDHKPLILNINGDTNSLEIIGSALETYFEVISIEYGSETSSLIKNLNVSLIILHSENYKEALKLLFHLNLVFPKIPLFLSSTLKDIDLILSSIRIGAKDFIPKPINPIELINNLNRVLANQKALSHGSSFIQKENIIISPFAFLNKLLLKLTKTFQNQKAPLIPEDDTDKHLKANENRIPSIKILNEFDRIQEEIIPEIEFLRNSQVEIRASLLGKFSVLVNDVPIEKISNKKAKSILAYLLFNHKKCISKERLMEKYWPESCIESAKNNLHVALHSIRKAFPKQERIKDFICFNDECYFINKEVKTYLDVESFLEYWKIARNTEKSTGFTEAIKPYQLASQLYKGEFYEDNYCDDWVATERESIREIYIVILDKLSQYAISIKDFFTVRNLALKILQLDPCREDIHRVLMWCYYQEGNREKAIKQYHKCCNRLQVEYDLNPAKSTIELFKKIKRLSEN